MWENFAAFAERPFKGAQEMSITDWFLFFGFAIVAAIIWRIIFTHIQEAL